MRRERYYLFCVVLALVALAGFASALLLGGLARAAFS